MLVAAAFCPCPPLLHPEVAQDAAPETEELRAACVAAAATLVASIPDLIVTLGLAPRTGPYASDARGSLAGFGVDVTLGTGSGVVALPASLALASWLLEQVGWDGAALSFGVVHVDEAARAVALGASVVERAQRVALLVMGDGSACRDAKAPGSFDDRAADFDDQVARALADVDTDVLAALDPELCDALMVGGRVPWQVAAGAEIARLETGAEAMSGRLLHRSAPYGVEYAVVTWGSDV